MSYNCRVRRRKTCKHYDEKTGLCERPGRTKSEINSDPKGIRITGCRAPIYEPMATHIMALTYAPKIEAVKAGTCKQTIRLKRSVEKKIGDKIILHTWAGKPYRSKWDWRLETRIIAVTRLRVFCGVWEEYIGIDDQWQPIDEGCMCSLGANDGIEPSTLRNIELTLAKLNGLWSLEYTQWEVIRW